MIFKFRLLSSEIDNFFCDIAIKSSQTFYHLHECIQDTVDYDNSQLASFFLTDENWEKEMQITLLDMNDPENKTLVMDRTRIGDHIKQLKQKMLYVFDFFSERSFFVELVEILEDTPGHFPKCVASGGEPPEQIKFGSSKANIFDEEVEEDYDDDFDDDMDSEFGEEFGDSANFEEYQDSEDFDR